MIYTKKPLSIIITSIMGLIGTATSYANNFPISKITNVTIYQGKASVNRQLPINAIGEQQIVFSCLSGNIDQDSIQVTAPQGVNIGEINVQTLKGEHAKLCQHQGNQNLANTQAQLDKINAKLQSQETTLHYLENFGKASQINIQGDLKTTIQQIKQSTEETALDVANLRQQKAQLESQLASDMNASGTVANRITQITVKLASHQKSQVNLNYLVNGASWQPQYQAKLDSQTGKLTLDLQAIVAQNTGENWQNVPLTLSTTQPTYQTSVYDPRPINLQIYDPETQKAVNLRTKSAMYMEDALPAPSAMLADDENYDAPLPSYQASINNKNDIIEYRLPQQVTIPSDGRRITTKLDSLSGQADVWARIVPEHERNSAYWYAKAAFLNKNWVDGEIQLYRDANFIGKGRFNREQLKNKGLGFGINKQILVTELDNSKKSDTTGIFGNKKVKQVDKSYRITNQLAQPIKIEMASGLPVAKDGQITVKSAYEPSPNVKDWHDKKGVIAWLFTLNPQEQKVIRQQHIIEYPNNKELID